MRRGWLRRSGLVPLLVITVLAVGTLGGALAAGWGPKLGLDLEGGFAVTLQPVEDSTDDTLDQAIEIIRTRVDALGVAEPEITRQGSTIVVSLPGVTDRERARELVGQTAELRFRPVLQSLPVDVDTRAELEEQLAELDPGTLAPEDLEGIDLEDLDLGELEDPDAVEGQGVEAAATPFQDDTTTTTAPDTTTTTTAPADPAASPFGDLPEDLTPTPRDEDEADQTVILEELDDEGNPIARYLLGPALVTGDAISGATARLDQLGQWSIEMDIRGGEGAESFNNLATECFTGSPVCPRTSADGSGQSAIVLDSRIVSVLGYQTPTFDGSANITRPGGFPEGEAKDLALVLQYGALPVALEVQATQEVSATLGTDSLRAAVIAGLIGLALVFAYMIAYYRLLGLVAMASLALSGVLLWTVVAWLGETQGLALTLAGITGIIVSIGIAVDSNVVFYEHLKENVSRGRSVRTAVSGSFASAFSTIVKADVASLIGAGVLYFLTVGPVRGFALFLGLSTLLDLVASYFFMRPLVVRLARSKRALERPGSLGLPDPTAVST
ncbi:MAG: protein translocase subunit SecD [Acidimicrobiales bacterium]